MESRTYSINSDVAMSVSEVIDGEIAPFALGVISVEIPYEPGIFTADMRHNYEENAMFLINK